MVDLFLILLQFQALVLQLFLALGQAHALGAFGGGQGLGQVGQLGAVALLLFVDIVGAQAGQQVALVAVQVDQRLETVLFAGVEQPVDGAFLVGLAVVGVKIVQEIAADDLPRRALAAQRVGDKAEVFFQRVVAVNHADELDKAGDDVVGKIFVVTDGDDVVRIGGVVAGGQCLVDSLPIKAFSIRPTSPHKFSAASVCDGVKNFRRTQIISWVSSSAVEPREIERKLTNSFVEFLACPSAILEGIDTAARRIWPESANNSALGSIRARRYTSSTSCIAFCQTINS